jgi:hypothetical protein
MRRLGSFRIKPRSRLLLRTAGLRFLDRFMDSCDLAASFHCRRWSRPTIGMGLARPTAGLGLARPTAGLGLDSLLATQ